VKALVWTAFILMALSIVQIAARFAVGETAPHANCCLCMCRAKDETKCSAMCIRLQHSKKIVELPAMNACTKECKRVHVIPVKD